jgi:hypothetical protein
MYTYIWFRTCPDSEFRAPQAIMLGTGENKVFKSTLAILVSHSQDGCLDETLNWPEGDHKVKNTCTQLQ